MRHAVFLQVQREMRGLYTISNGALGRKERSSKRTRFGIIDQQLKRMGRIYNEK